MLPIETVLDLLMANARHREWFEPDGGFCSRLSLGLLGRGDVMAVRCDDLRSKVRTYLETLAENANAAG